jgi:hypothetical protein
MSWPEVEEGIAELARTRGHRDRLKALELLAKLHGKLDPKLSVTVDRTTIEEHLSELLQQMALNKQELAIDVTPSQQQSELAAGATPPTRQLPS